ncbi:hypothetical protein K4L44_04205 [Halosquirtibacter laminarini]|uniref:Uncharacterized protein n=1 Tax=Halosquirtibacter laminarini TaxID=3374600 RepID=A0AC61NHB8_9BACT|nr:hypothetical protein K4L44_04205 [Prolixibacteraceae bacterium]
MGAAFKYAATPYIKDQMILPSPDKMLDKAVAFNQYLLDLAYNQRLIVCDLFRWRDIWSRDLGSGFGSDALYTNRIQATYKCIDYNLNPYNKA